MKKRLCLHVGERTNYHYVYVCMHLSAYVCVYLGMLAYVCVFMHVSLHSC